MNARTSTVGHLDGRVGEEASAELRRRLHAMWSAVSAGWAEHADYVDSRAATVTERLLELSAPYPGDRVLELACGPGGMGLAVAPRVVPDGEVVLSDVALDMVAIAAARAEMLGLRNVTTAALDLESIDQADKSYDVVLCREGLMFALDPARAAREIRRVLRPGGRVALAVWGPPEHNPWLDVVLQAVGAELGHPVPPPGIPGPFSLQDSDKLAALLADAELSDVAVCELRVPLRAASFEEWWNRTCALAGPLTKILSSLPEDASRSVEARARAATRAYETPHGLEFPGMTLLASARRP